MALSLDGTTGITSDGGTPVIENLDTTATGIAVTGELTTTGNLGLGVTPSGWTTLKPIEFAGGASLAGFSNTAFLGANCYFNGSWRYIQTATSGRYETGDSHKWFSAPSGTAGNAISFTQAMTLTASGDLNIGDSGNFGGRVSLAFNPATQHGIILAVSSGTFTNNYIAFQNSGGSKIGSISSNNSTVAYNTSSDYRLKEDWVAVADASTRVNALKPINFAWKATGERVDGFLAHELAEVVPEAVSGEKDAMRDEEYEVTPAVKATYDEEGNELTPAVEAITGTRSVPDYQGIDQSKLVPLLTAALQEALAKIDDLTARVVALEGQP